MKKTGEVLKKAREEKGLSLHEVGIFLKINTRILQAIENGDMSKLPAKTFLRGFVQSYAKYLKLNSDEVLSLFQSEIKPQLEEPVLNTTENLITAEIEKSEEVIAEKPTPTEVETGVPNRSSTNQSVLMGPGLTTDTLKLKTIIISALALVLVFVVYFGNNLIRRYQKEAEVPEEISALSKDSESIQNEIAREIPDSLSPNVTESTIITSTPATTALINPPTANLPAPATNEPPNTQPVVAAPTAPTTPSPAPAPSPASAATSAPTATQQKTANETTSLPTSSQANSTNETKPTEGRSLEVIVEAKDSVEIEYASAKSNPQKLLLKGDQIHTFKSRSGIRLKISNGGAVNIIVNGQDLGAPGALGQSVQLTYQ